MIVQNNKGLTALELLVATAVLMTVLVGFYIAIFSSTRTTDQLQIHVHLQETARSLMNIISRDIRMAGSAPNGVDSTCSVVCEGIISADTNNFEFTMDLDGDMCCDGPGERIQYQYDDDNNELCRKNSSSAACEVIVGDQDGSAELTNFSFVYYDHDGDKIINPGLNLDQIASVRVVAKLVPLDESLTQADLKVDLNFHVNIRNMTLGR